VAPVLPVPVNPPGNLTKAPAAMFSFGNPPRDYQLYLEAGAVVIAGPQRSAECPQVEKSFYAQQSHVCGGNLFFVLQHVTRYVSKYLYKFDPDRNEIECIYGNEKEFHFVEDRAVIFGTNCNIDPCTQGLMRGTAVITILDLNKVACSRISQRYNIETPGSGILTCWVDAAVKMIIAVDQAGRRRILPIA
jgi:hypothetical protein